MICMQFDLHHPSQAVDPSDLELLQKLACARSMKGSGWQRKFKEKAAG